MKEDINLNLNKSNQEYEPFYRTKSKQTKNRLIGNIIFSIAIFCAALALFGVAIYWAFILSQFVEALSVTMFGCFFLFEGICLLKRRLWAWGMTIFICILYLFIGIFVFITEIYTQGILPLMIGIISPIWAIGFCVYYAVKRKHFN